MADRMAQMTLVPRRNIPDSLWNNFVDHHSHGWFWHRTEWLDYSKVYRPDAVDLSVALVDDWGEVVGVCPCIKESDRVAMGGVPCAGPLVSSGVDLKDAASLILGKFVAFTHHSEPHGHLAWRWTFRNHRGREVERWLISLEDKGLIRTGWWTQAIDLKKSPSVLWRNIRKSYRPLISRALRDYQVWRTDDFQSYKEVHQKATNYERQPETYTFQREWVEKGFGAIITAHKRGAKSGGATVTPEFRSSFSGGASPPPSTIPHPNQCVAASYAIIYKNRAYYASGPSLERNVQHALQWETMRSVNVSDYEIGWIGEPNGKGSIEFFKSGFGGVLEPVTVLSTEGWQ